MVCINMRSRRRSTSLDAHLCRGCAKGPGETSALAFSELPHELPHGLNRGNSSGAIPITFPRAGSRLATGATAGEGRVRERPGPHTFGPDYATHTLQP